MRPFLFFFLGVVTCSGLFAQPDTLTILHVNDTHSNLMTLAPRNPDLTGQRGGIARVASFVGMTKMTEPNVLFLHAGDISIGDPMYNYYFGVPEYVILSQLGLDAMAVGNHEFDLTPAMLQMALDTAASQGLSFPLLSANLILDDPGVSDLKSYIQPHMIKNIGGLKVGIFGMTTPETMLLSLPGPAAIDTSEAAVGLAAATEVATLAAETCDVIIMLSHLGHYVDRIIAENVTGINVIVGGHDHERITTPDAVVNPLGDTTWIVQAGSVYEYVGHLRLSVEGSAVRMIDYATVPMDENIPEEPQTKAVVEQLASEEEAAFDVPFFSQAIGMGATFQTELLTDLMDRRTATTDVGTLLTVSFREVVPCDVALTVCGATAQPIYAGPITPADLFRAIGYGFNEDTYLGYRVARFQISGSDLMMGLEFGLSSIELNDEFFVVGDLLSYYYDPQQSPFGRLDSAFINGQPIDPSATYTVATNEFVLAVLRDFVGPQLGMTLMNDTVLSMTEFEALLAHVTSVESEDVLATHPTSYALSQNFPNPFNPSTTIQYSIPTGGLVNLAVFDLLGRRIETLVYGDRPAGTHRVTWNAAVASGVYFYRLDVVDQSSSVKYSSVRRMVLLK